MRKVYLPLSIPDDAEWFFGVLIALVIVEWIALDAKNEADRAKRRADRASESIAQLRMELTGSEEVEDDAS